MTRSLRRSSAASLALALALVSARALPAQSAILDHDRAARPTVTLGPSETLNGRPSLVVRREFAMPAGQRYRVEGANGTPCDLVIERGGILRLLDTELEVRGDVRILAGGYCEIVRARVRLLNSFAREFNYLWSGGHLSTQNVTIGGNTNLADVSVPSVFDLPSGLWTARDTIVRDSYGIQLGSRHAPAGAQGGQLVADGLQRGRTSDALLLSGRGDATLKNSTFPVQLSLYPERAGTIDIDLTWAYRIRRVYGDRNAHDALRRAPVTDHIEGSPWRLELDNTQVPLWTLGVHDVTPQSPPVTYRVHNAFGFALRIDAGDLRGSPQLVGPWRTFYPLPRALPGLPTTFPPGEHGIPPGCGVQIGAITIAAPANDWAYPESWSFGLWGANTDFRVLGAGVIAELFLTDARATLEGGAAYDLQVRATSLHMTGQSSLVLRNALVGSPHTWQPELTVRAQSVVDIADCRVETALLHTTPGEAGTPWAGVDQASITVRDSLITGNLTELRSPGSTISIARAQPHEDSDFSNTDFERGVQTNGNPEFWSGAGVQGYTSGDTAPPGWGTRSFGYRSTATTGAIQKRLRAQPRTRFELLGWVKALSLPAGASLALEISGSSGNRRLLTFTPTPGVWTPVRSPMFEVGDLDTTTTLRIAHGSPGGTVDVLLDRFEISLLPWFDVDNLANLDFEDPHYPELGGKQVAPRHWTTWRGIAKSETLDLRPGAAPGSRAARIDTIASSGVFKALFGLLPGQTVRATGWIKGVPHASGPFGIGFWICEGNECWFRTDYGNNVMFGSQSGTGWQRFDLTYVVPAAPWKDDTTWLVFHGGATGATMLIDDVAVEIR